MEVKEAIEQLQHFQNIHPGNLLLKGYDNKGDILSVHAFTLNEANNIVAINMTVDPVKE